MGEFVRILKISRSMTVSLQLLQTMSIMIQNLKNEHAICKMMSIEVNLFKQHPHTLFSFLYAFNFFYSFVFWFLHFILTLLDGSGG